jgi:hypothetical protein
MSYSAHRKFILDLQQLNKTSPALRTGEAKAITELKIVQQDMSQNTTFEQGY